METGEGADGPGALRYGLADSALGSVLVATQGADIVAIFLGDDAAALVAQLRGSGLAAAPAGDDAAHRRLVGRVVRQVEAPARACTLPLRLGGTPFTRRVWEALRRLPPGRAVAYGELAARLGAPRAARAVARACAANMLAVAVPCHRVVRGDGGMGGYRWGVARKRALLAREAAARGGRSRGGASARG